MELVEGRTLTELIPKGGLSLAQLLQIAIPLADAAGATHQRGITHRDLKPSNVMLGNDGRLKVLGFGLAKLRELEADANPAAALSTAALTGEGRIVGTVAYMSPEQAEGGQSITDPTSSPWASSSTRWRQVSGRSPATRACRSSRRFSKTHLRR